MGLRARAGLDHHVDPALGESLNRLGHERDAALALGLLLRYRDLHLWGVGAARGRERVVERCSACAVAETRRAMSQVNLDSLRRLAEAFGRRDFDRAMEHFADDVEVRPAVVGIDVGTRYSGREELRGFWKQINEAWEAQSVELTETIEAPGERIVAVEQWHVRGRDGIELDFDLIDVYSFRDGLIVRIDGFRDRAEALEAVGLSE